MVKEALTTKRTTMTASSDNALIAFNQLMRMETFALADHPWLAMRSGLNTRVAFRTRLMQIDRPMRSDVRDPLQHVLRKILRRIWFRSTTIDNESNLPAYATAGKGEDVVRRWYQNTGRFAETTSRFLFGIIAGAVLVAPMIIMSYQANSKSRVLTVALSIVLFSFLVALVSRASPQETMAASAAYAAVQAVFISTANQST